MAIEILPARLANQIAAGEVVERPASVIKELVENSLDAGATSIKIDIEKGGAKSIRIADNGKGIAKAELVLALSRHATSKIKNLNDLEAISSLGFRGEALASISSVSRLTLTSKPADQESAWQANAEGRDMDVSINPAAHPDGTTIEVNDLFFNTPARRKFLRTEKTEFSHIEEVIRRIALARFDVTFILSHNGNVVKQYRAARNENQNAKRVAQICGAKFIEHAIEINCQHDDLRLWGWLAKPEFSRSQNDLAYSYVNGRMMRDKLINHAIRQAYANYLPTDSYPAFVLFLELDYREVDVNVHPAKHEVRFHQGRYIHDFIFSVCHDGLTSQPSFENFDHSSTETPHSPSASIAGDSGQNNAIGYSADYITPLQKVAETPKPFSSANTHQPYSQATHRVNTPSKQGVHAYNQLMATPAHLPQVASEPLLNAEESSQSESVKRESSTDHNSVSTLTNSVSKVCIVSIVEKKLVVIRIKEQLRLLALAKIEQQVNEALVAVKVNDGMISQPLLLPVKLSLTKTQFALIQQYPEQWLMLGIHVQEQPNLTVQIRQLPALLRQKDVSQSIYTMLAFLEGEQESKALATGKNIDTNALNSIFKQALASSFISDEYTIQSAEKLLTSFYKAHETQFLSQLMLNSREIDLTSVIKQLL